MTNSLPKSFVRGLRHVLAIAAALCAMLFALPAAAAPAAGYWWNPSASGSGFVIEVQNNVMFMAGFLYSANGEASWVASTGQMSSATLYTGSLITYSGGETLTGTYQPATPGPTLGTITINFATSTTGSLTWPGGTIPIQRFDFGPGGSGATQPATNPQTGWWWNPGEGGRGFAVEVQGGQMYFAGYMYDTSGNATWYLASGAMTSAGLFQGNWTQYGGGPTLTGPYKAPSSTVNAGTITMQFNGTAGATMTLPNGRQIPLERFNFSGVSGPVLSAFSPASGAPAGVLTIQGANIDPTAALSLTLSDSTGYSVSVPLTTATATSVTAAIPPYINPTTGVFGSGTVNVKLTQTSGATSVDSNSLSGFGITQIPKASAKAGTGTLALIQANLSEAQKLQTSIKGTAQDTPAVEAAITTQVADLQKLVTGVELVLQNGQSFALGSVGGVNITVTPTNIADVDNLILASLQSLASPTIGAKEKGAEQVNVACMEAEAEAFVQALLTGTGNFQNLATALIEAPGTTACNTAGAFISAYQIFGGAGNVGIGITDGAGTGPGASLPGAALFSLTNSNASIEIGLNALLASALVADASVIQNAIGSVTALSQPEVNEIIAKATGDIATVLNNSQTFINTVAPPPTASVVPTNLPLGTYAFSYSFNYTIQGQVIQQSYGPYPLPNTDASLFASELQGEISDFNSSNCNSGGTTCSAVVTPFNGTTFQVVFTINGPGISGTITYNLTKTG